MNASEVEQLARQLNPNLSLDYSSYINTSSKAKWHEDGFGWFEREPRLILKKKILHHPKYSKQKTALNIRKPIDEVIKQAAVKNPDWELIAGTYVNCISKCEWRHKETGEIVKRSPQNVFCGQIEILFTADTALDKLKDILPPEVTMIKESFKRWAYPCRWVDTEYGEFTRTPLSVYQGYTRHPMVKTRKLTAETVQERVKLLNPDLLLDVSTYKNVRTKCLWIDGEHGSFLRTPSDVMGGKVFHPNTARDRMYQTSIQNGTIYESKEEVALKEWIESLGYETCKKCIKAQNGRQKIFNIDIVVESAKLAIEYDGAYWHSSANPKMYRSYHRDKDRAILNAGYKILHIWDVDWHHKKEIIKAIIKAKLGSFDKRIYARDCSFVQLNKQQARNFLDSYHLQGSVNFQYSYGLIVEEDLVAVATIGKHHRNNTDLVVNRICFKGGIQIIGGLSKISKHIKDIFPNTKLITWCDPRYAQTVSYEKAGWTIDKYIAPDRLYYNNYKKIFISKQARSKKKVNTPPGMTELDHAKQDGLYIVYDSGKIRLTL